MRTVTVQAGVTIDLGHQYDNYATEVVFPSAIIDPFITNFGSSGTFAIWYRRQVIPLVIQLVHRWSRLTLPTARLHGML